MILMVESIDEKLVCVTLRVITVTAGVTACIAKVLSGNVYTGTTYNFVTRNKVREGKVTNLI